jgi:hypothetical protein
VSATRADKAHTTLFTSALEAWHLCDLCRVPKPAIPAQVRAVPPVMPALAPTLRRHSATVFGQFLKGLEIYAHSFERARRNILIRESIPTPEQKHSYSNIGWLYILTNNVGAPTFSPTSFPDCVVAEL